MRRVLHILYSGLGGHGSVVFSYLQKQMLSSAKNQLLFFGIEDVVPEYMKLCQKREVKYIFLRKPLKGNLSAAVKFYKILRKETPHIILNHSLPTVPIIILYQFFQTTKSVLVVHTPFERHRFSDIVYFFLSLLFFDKVVLLTKSEYDLAQKKFGRFLNPSKTEILPNGIDLEKFSPQNKQKFAETIFSTHCRITEQKDLPTLIKGFGIFIKRNKGNYRLKIAGDGTLLDDIKKLAVTLDIDQYIDFTGLLNEAEIVSFLINTQIYINTSKQEAMSTSIMQAMACGLPCIVSNINANLELVKDNENGLVFTLSDCDDLANKMKLISEDLFLAERLGVAARETAQSKFSNSQMIDKYLRLITE